MSKIQDIIRLTRNSGACEKDLNIIKRQFRDGMTSAQFIKALKEHGEARFWVHWLFRNGLIPAHFELEHNKAKDVCFTKYLKERKEHEEKEGIPYEERKRINREIYDNWVAEERKLQNTLLNEIEAWLLEDDGGKQLQSSEGIPPLGSTGESKSACS